MNRIYQGRVSKVEIPGDKENPWQPLQNWQDILPVAPKRSEGRWQHQEFFQDAEIDYTSHHVSL
jgi:hypothetical protein